MAHLIWTFFLFLFNFKKWPSHDVPGFRDKQVSFFKRCKELSLRVLRLMGLSLGLDADVFVSAHKQIGSKYSITSTIYTL